jgi:hypothetical protein
MHPGAVEASVDVDDLDPFLTVLTEHQPYYILFLLQPDQLDVNLSRQWLTLTSRIDPDPFVDARTGFITGRSPETAAELVERIEDVVVGRIRMPRALIDNLGPNPGLDETDFTKRRGSFFLPVYARDMPAASISHGVRGFTQKRLDSMAGAGILHFGGHGFPDRVVDCLNGPHVRRLTLDPALVFNGACYTGVTGDWFDVSSGRLARKTVRPEIAFSLQMLANNAVAYLASLHPDHGIPVYQEMEYLAFSGGSLGEVIKSTYDGLVLARGGRRPVFERLEPGRPNPDRTPADIMINGTASRLLFGDPSLVVTPAFTAPPFQTTFQTDDPDRTIMAAQLVNNHLKSWFTDTYYSDLCAPQVPFNDRALITARLPDRLPGVAEVEVLSVSTDDPIPRYRLVGFAVERDRGHRVIHVQVDAPATGYMQSKLRNPKAVIRLALHH